jgi:hypothetical protein
LTSLQGKRLEQLYSKAHDFHTGRRTWYLPIAPTPDHPDALSKKTKKRFPTLELANGATLRWDSYVNIRHVYKIEMSLLKPYTNAECPVEVFRFERESLIRMLAKGKTLTLYEPGPQFLNASLTRSRTEPINASNDESHHAEDEMRKEWSPASDAISVPSIVPSMESETQGDFREASTDGSRLAGPIPKVPPNGERGSVVVSMVHDVVVQPMARLVENSKSLAKMTNKRLLTPSLDIALVRQLLYRAWRDFKGFTAVVIASV